jgi:DNA-binding PadR family transcriptional regulator
VTNAELAILSLVVEQPRHGYDIEATIAERNMRDWTDIGFSSIYYVLNKLESAGLVISEREPAPGRGPARRVYSTTEEGIDTLRREALAALAGPARRPSSFQLGLATLPYLDGDDVAEAIADHGRELETRLEVLTERREAAASLAGPDRALPFHVAAMFDLGAVQIGAELDWLRRFATDLDRRRDTERSQP